MPNRIIKESICSSDTVDKLTWFEEVVFYRLIVNCDDYGRFDGRPSIIRSRLFPLKTNVTDKSVMESINKLSTVGLVILYEYEDKPYLQLATWDKHQQVRAKRSKYPAFDSTCNQMISDDCTCPRNPIQSESESLSESISPKGDVNVFFERVWKLYPNKKGKGQVSDKNRRELQAVGYEQLARCIERYTAMLARESWRKPQDGRTFFHSGYLDYLDSEWQEPAKPVYVTAAEIDPAGDTHKRRITEDMTWADMVDT